jgi:hypothetical protein
MKKVAVVTGAASGTHGKSRQRILTNVERMQTDGISPRFRTICIRAFNAQANFLRQCADSENRQLRNPTCGQKKD